MEPHLDEAIERFFRQGRLVVIPAKRTTRLVVLAALATCFDTEHTYSEAEVNAILLRFHDDYCYLRRELVDGGFLERIASGSEYRRACRKVE